MRAPSAILRSLSLRRIQPTAAVAVAPLPVKTRFDQELTAELDALLSHGGELGLAQLLDAAITTQKIALNSLVKIPYRDDADRGAVEEYLENDVEILDACNHFVDRIENLKKYVDSLRVVLRVVDNNGRAINDAMAISTTTRALGHLESRHNIEKKCKAIEKFCGSSLRKMLRQKLAHETEFSEILCGSKAMALMGCTFLELGLSFDSKRGFSTTKESQPMSSSWLRLLQELQKRGCGSLSSMMTCELQPTVTAARELKEQILKGKRENEMKLKSAVERVQRTCRELEDGLEVIEGKLKDLYKSLIDLRMALLGILSQA